MAEYIDRDDVIKTIMKWEDKPYFSYHAVLRDVMNLSPADVVPRENYKSMGQTVDKLNKSLFFLSTIKRNRGKWIYNDMSRRICSNCGNPVAFKLIDGNWYEGDFCPNCGARMVEDADV